MTSKDPREAVNSYITDMLALEAHIKRALEGQVADLKNHPQLQSEVERTLSTVEFHISALEGLANARNAKGLTEKIKAAGSAVLGVGAAAVDLIRNEGIAKDLRDDYTAFNHATISYVMLRTTALALGDQEAANLAQRHMQDYVQVVMRMHNLVPGAVLQLLREEGLPVDESVLPQLSREIESMWKNDAGVPSAAQASAQAR
jgi:ferritin-like metal-binding protein YciE